MVVTRGNKVDKMSLRTTISSSSPKGEEKPTEHLRRGARYNSNATEALQNAKKTKKVQIVKRKKSEKKTAAASVATVASAVINTGRAGTSKAKSVSPKQKTIKQKTAKQKTTKQKAAVKQEEIKKKTNEEIKKETKKEELSIKKEKKSKQKKTPTAKEQKTDAVEKIEKIKTKKSDKTKPNGIINKQIDSQQITNDDLTVAGRNSQGKRITVKTNSSKAPIIKKTQSTSSTKRKGKRRGRPAMNKLTNETNANMIAISDENIMNVNATKDYEEYEDDEEKGHTEKNQRSYFSWLWRLVPKIRS